MKILYKNGLKNNQNALAKISTKPEVAQNDYFDSNELLKSQSQERPKTKTIYSTKYSKTEKNLLKINENSKMSYTKLHK